MFESCRAHLAFRAWRRARFTRQSRPLQAITAAELFYDTQIPEGDIDTFATE
jgi:hypothetical protein